MGMLFGKAITAKGSKFMLDPKAEKAEKKSKFFRILGKMNLVKTEVPRVTLEK